MTATPGYRARWPAAGALLAQFFFGLVLGGWAAGPATTASRDDMAVYGAVATVFALAFALAAANGLRLLAGLVALAADLPGFLRKFTTPRPGLGEREQRQDRSARVAATVAHAVVLSAALLLIAAVLAGLSAAGFPQLALRYLVVAAMLSAFTWSALDAV